MNSPFSQNGRLLQLRTETMPCSYGVRACLRTCERAAPRLLQTHRCSRREKDSGQRSIPPASPPGKRRRGLLARPPGEPRERLRSSATGLPQRRLPSPESHLKNSCTPAQAHRRAGQHRSPAPVSDEAHHACTHWSCAQGSKRRGSRRRASESGKGLQRSLGAITASAQLTDVLPDDHVRMPIAIVPAVASCAKFLAAVHFANSAERHPAKQHPHPSRR